MSRANPLRLAGMLTLIVVVFAGFGLAKGELLIGKHEGDLLHLLDLLYRVELGQVPHIDFTTPIGALALWPINLFLGPETGPGVAILRGQALVAAALLPFVWWVAASRLSLGLGVAFGAVVLTLPVAMVHGDTIMSVSLSMHYNRWAWAIAFVAIALVMLEPLRRGSATSAVDGLTLGLAMAALLLIKVTYFVAFGPAVLVALLVRRDWTALGIAALVGLGVLGLVTAFHGHAFWLAYLRDLLVVSTSEIRSAPGHALNLILGAPAFFGATVTALLGVVLLRQGGRMAAGLILLLLFPGFMLVTWQNWGNDPQWLYILPILLLALRPEPGETNGFGWDLRQATTMAAVAAIAMGGPSLLNVAYSPVRNLLEDNSENVAFYKEGGGLFAHHVRANTVDARVPLDVEEWGLAHIRDEEVRGEALEIAGEVLPECEVALGLPAIARATAEMLGEMGFGPGDRILTADVSSNLWLFGETEPVRGAAPWYYGGLPGIQDATHVLVPRCPSYPRAQQAMLEALEEAGVPLAVASRQPLFILFRIGEETSESGEEQIADERGAEGETHGEVLAGPALPLGREAADGGNASR